MARDLGKSLCLDLTFLSPSLSLHLSHCVSLSLTLCLCVPLSLSVSVSLFLCISLFQPRLARTPYVPEDALNL